VPVSRADREAEPPVKRRRRVEIAHRMNDMIEAARHPVLSGLRISRRKQSRALFQQNGTAHGAITAGVVAKCIVPE
jgi:hypothetical protein